MTKSQTFLIIGFGSIGRRHTNNILKITNSKVVILTKRKNIQINEFYKYNSNFPRINVCSNFQDCLKENPSIAFITNETSLHTHLALKLAKHGIDLFIEKPLSHSMKNIVKLKQVIKKNRLIVMVGCNFRFYPPIKKIKEIVEHNLAGRPISVQCENSSFLPDWHPGEDYAKGYAAKKNLGGGVTLTQIHEFDYLNWIFGPIQKHCSIIKKISDLKINVDDICSCIFELKSKTIVELHMDFFSKLYYKRIKIRGTKGIIYWNSDINKVNFYNYSSNTWKTIKINNNYKLTGRMINRMYEDELKYFIKCIKNRKEPMNNFDEAVQILKTVIKLKS